MKRPHIDRIAGWYAIATQVLTLALVLVLGAHAQTNQTSFPAQSFTATSQTGAVINLTGGFALGTIEVYGTITTVSWELQGTNDGGLHWFLMQTNPITNPGSQATSQTASAATMYAASLSGLTNIKITTLGTFTGTGVYFKVTATPLGYRHGTRCKTGKSTIQCACSGVDCLRTKAKHPSYK
jgi:hypothetical protein